MTREYINDWLGIIYGSERQPWWVWVWRAVVFPLELGCVLGMLLLMCICSAGSK